MLSQCIICHWSQISLWVVASGEIDLPDGLGHFLSWSGRCVEAGKGVPSDCGDDGDGTNLSKLHEFRFRLPPPRPPFALDSTLTAPDINPPVICSLPSFHQLTRPCPLRKKSKDHAQLNNKVWRFGRRCPSHAVGTSDYCTWSKARLS